MLKIFRHNGNGHLPPEPADPDDVSRLAGEADHLLTQLEQLSADIYQIGPIAHTSWDLSDYFRALVLERSAVERRLDDVIAQLDEIAGQPGPVQLSFGGWS